MKISKISKINFFQSQEPSLKVFTETDEGLFFSERKSNSHISQKELFKFLKKNKNNIERIILTRGNPLSFEDADSFLRKIKKMGFKMELETYGFYPQKLKKALEDKLLDSIRVNIPACKKKYSKVFRKNGSFNYITQKVEDSIGLAKAYNIEDNFETSLKDFLNREDIIEIGKWIAPAYNYTLVQKQNESVSHLKISNKNNINSSDFIFLRKALSPFIENINIIA